MLQSLFSYIHYRQTAEQLKEIESSHKSSVRVLIWYLFYSLKNKHDRGLVPF